MLGREEGARSDLAEAMKQEPSNEQDWVYRGTTRMKSQPEESLKDFNRALELNPRYFAALQNKAHVLAELLKRRGEALEVMNQIVKYFPDRVLARADRGVLLARLGDDKAARRDADYALTLDRSAYCRYQV